MNFLNAVLGGFITVGIPPYRGVFVTWLCLTVFLFTCLSPIISFFNIFIVYDITVFPIFPLLPNQVALLLLFNVNVISEFHSQKMNSFVNSFKSNRKGKWYYIPIGSTEIFG